MTLLYDTHRILPRNRQNQQGVTFRDFKELNGGAGEVRTPDLRFRNSEGCFDWSWKLSSCDGFYVS